ncbi:GCN5-related N-acetyltransferase [Alphaproteobacteria bacterium]|nr:GCN5-related N-acetyltransferase [Alphaproteobacteria bacterium]
MRFNLVVQTNEGAVRLWKYMGISVMRTVPGGFNYRKYGYINAYIMYQLLS